MNYTISLSDGSQESFSFEPCGLDLAQKLGLRKKAVGLKINGEKEISDIRTTLKDGDKVNVIFLPSPESLEVVRHSAAHCFGPGGAVSLAGSEGHYRACC